MATTRRKKVPVIPKESVRSHPTLCLSCHLIVEMYHEKGADPVTGHWTCPKCGHEWLFTHWKIKRKPAEKPALVVS